MCKADRKGLSKKNIKTTVSSDEAGGSRDLNPMIVLFLQVFNMAFKKPPNQLICTEYHFGVDICQSLYVLLIPVP